MAASLRARPSRNRRGLRNLHPNSSLNDRGSESQLSKTMDELSIGDEAGVAGGGGKECEIVTQRVYLAIGQPVKLQRENTYYIVAGREGQGQNAVAHYGYYSAKVPVSMSFADQQMYPSVYETLKTFSNSVGDNSGQKTGELTLLFNGPKPGWGDFSYRASDAISDRYFIRTRIEKSDFLKELMASAQRSGFKVNIKGYLWRQSFRRGRPFPFPLDDKMISLEVDADGSTNDVTFKFIPKFFQAYDVSGTFTVELEWSGYELKIDFKSCRRCEVLVKDSDKDVTVTCGNEVSFRCHSWLLKESSPVFSAMLKTDMKESRSQSIAMDDVDPATFQAFLDYIYEGQLLEVCKNSDLCFNLYVFSEKCLIENLKEAMRTILQFNREEWVATETALNLFIYADKFSTAPHKKLRARALSILQKRTEELEKIEEYRELIKENPEVQKQLNPETGLIFPQLLVAIKKSS